MAEKEANFHDVKWKPESLRIFSLSSWTLCFGLFQLPVSAFRKGRTSRVKGHSSVIMGHDKFVYKIRARTARHNLTSWEIIREKLKNSVSPGRNFPNWNLNFSKKKKKKVTYEDTLRMEFMCLRWFIYVFIHRWNLLFIQIIWTVFENYFATFLTI